MVEVKGKMKLDPSPNAHYDMQSVEEMQKTTCTRWINRDYPERCAEFDRDKWLAASKDLATKPMHFCMDRYEYPNDKGAYPVIYVSWHEAVELCAEEGKRLCNEAEWTFACEGEEATPYPYGYVRDATACVVDQKWRPYNETALRPRNGFAAMAELDKLWQGVPSGSQPRCRSPFGVYDMTGNVDEWTRTVREGERPSILKGGYWGPVRTRCRPSTRSHDENHTFYQQGFRCCSDPGAAVTRRAASYEPTKARLPREVR
jgi:formylglycine-generating enzyme required for sulfatase activity